MVVVGRGLWTVLAAVCLQTLCDSFRSTSNRDHSSFSFFSREGTLDASLSRDPSNPNRNLVSYCTSIDRTEAENQINEMKRKPQRFIHPQVRLMGDAELHMIQLFFVREHKYRYDPNPVHPLFLWSITS